MVYGRYNQLDITYINRAYKPAYNWGAVHGSFMGNSWEFQGIL